MNITLIWFFFSADSYFRRWKKIFIAIIVGKKIVTTHDYARDNNNNNNKNVAFGPNSHKINCQRQDFVSVKIGTYELPFKEFQNIRFVFQKTSSIYSVEPTATGNQTFLITKFLSLGTNVRIRRTYDNTEDLTIDMKIKPSVTLGIGRKNSTVHMASFMFCDNQVRVNHFQNIGQSGTVSFNLRTP